MAHTDKIVTLKDECDRMGLEVLAPDVNTSAWAFVSAGARRVRYGLGAIKGMGEGAAENIVAQRAAGGQFRSIDDLCRRVDLNRVNRRVLEALIRSGSLDGLGPNRATLMARLPAAMQLGEQTTRAVQTGQDDLFGLGAPAGGGTAPCGAAADAAPIDGLEIGSPPALPEWSETLRLAVERETLGLYLTGHPISRY